MDPLNTDIQNSDREERKYRRYPLECPVLMKFQSLGATAEVTAVSENVSIGGLMVRSPSMIPRCTQVKFTIQIHREHAFRPIYLSGEGEIVRVEKGSVLDDMFGVAVECKNPITQLEGYLPQG